MHSSHKRLTLGPVALMPQSSHQPYGELCYCYCPLLESSSKTRYMGTYVKNYTLNTDDRRRILFNIHQDTFPIFLLLQSSYQKLNDDDVMKQGLRKKALQL